MGQEAMSFRWFLQISLLNPHFVGTLPQLKRFRLHIKSIAEPYSMAFVLKTLQSCCFNFDHVPNFGM